MNALSLLVFKDIRFKYEPYLCNGCHDLMQKAVSFNNIAIAYIKGNILIFNVFPLTN